MTQIFIDLDGVLADFDQHYENMFGYRPCKIKDDVDWSLIRARPNFYRYLPLMEDAHLLWNYVSITSPRSPIVLTGVPSSIPEASFNKRAWVAEHFGAGVKVLTCFSKDKCMHAQPGDILVDDWEKYRQRWLDVGGRFITHISAEDSIRQLKEMGI